MVVPKLLMELAFGLLTGMLAVWMSKLTRNQLIGQVDHDESDAFYPPVWLPGISSGWLDRILVLTLTLISLVVFRHQGVGIDAFAMLFFCAMTLTLAHIDLVTGLLPDRLTRPLLVVGLLFHAFGGWVPFLDSMLGAALAYGLLRGVFGLYYWKTGRAGMGYGDFKLAAAIGAWLGALSVPMLLFIASSAGVLLGVIAQYAGKLDKGNAFPFGPFLSVAGILVLLWA